MQTLIRLTFLILLCNSLTNGAAAQSIIGWRTDGTGVYPNTTPPLEWSRDKNIVWKTKLPERSYGSPILVGKRIFVVSDPAELLCVQAEDGKILWQRSISIADVFGDKKAKQITEAWKTINEKRRDLQRAYAKLRKEEPNAKDKRQKMRDRIEAVDLKIREMRKSTPVPGRNGAGNSAGTPVSDGKSVYVSFGHGIVAAFDVDGKRQWVRFVEGSEIGFGHASSPVLVDGKLIVHYHDLVALHAGSGKEVWRTKATARHASPVVARIAEQAVLISPAGGIVRVRDGKMIATHEGLRASECSPIVADGIIYAQHGKTSAFRLPKTAADDTKMEPLWQIRTSRGRRTPSAVHYKGLLYGVNTSGLLEVIDSKTGKLVYAERLNIGNVYSSPTIAGDRLYITSTRGDTVVLKTGHMFQPLAKNELENCGSCPVFVGSRMYIRCHRHLYCIGK